VEVTSASMRFVTPVAAAVTITAPVRVPRVTVVAATPVASVVAEEGARTTPPPPPVTLKATFVPETARPLASETFTEKVPTEVVTAPCAAGEATTSICAAGPTFGPEESEPHAASATSANRAGEKWRERITGS
jgi:hypothetical protein